MPRRKSDEYDRSGTRGSKIKPEQSRFQDFEKKEKSTQLSRDFDQPSSVKLEKPDLYDKKRIDSVVGELKIVTKDLEKELRNQIGGEWKNCESWKMIFV